VESLSYFRFCSDRLESFGNPPRPAAGYTGPGDVVSGTTAWWGMRAYSNATTGGNAIDVFGNSTLITFTFVTKSDGTLELSAGGASTFISANGGGLVITKFYDQTGNGHDMTASGGNTPTMVTSGLGSFAIATFSSNKLSATGFAVSQPFTVSGVFKTTTSGGVQALLTDSPGAQFLLIATPQLRVQANTALNGSTTLSSGTWYPLLGVYNGASSAVELRQRRVSK
jgi:hypothetical protein